MFNPDQFAARAVAHGLRRTPCNMRKAVLIAALKHIARALTVMTSKEDAAMELYAVGDQTIVSREAA